MDLICTGCFIRPAPAGAAHESDRTVVCPEGHLVTARPGVDSLRCGRCGEPIHFDGLARLWYAH